MRLNPFSAISHTWQRRIAYLFIIVYMTGLTAWTASNEAARHRDDRAREQQHTRDQDRAAAASAALSLERRRDNCMRDERSWENRHSAWLILTAHVDPTAGADPALRAAQRAGNRRRAKQRVDLLAGLGERPVWNEQAGTCT